MNSHDIFVQHKLKQVARFIPENSIVLDIGCEDGKLKDFLSGCRYYGIDINKKHVKKLTKQGIQAEQVDLNKDEIPFKNQKFDYIVMLDVLEHILNPRKLLAESKKRLKKNGKLIISLPNDYHLLNKIRFILNKHLTEDPFAPYGHLHYFPIKSGEKLITSQGLKILRKDYIAPVKPAIIPQSIKEFLAKKFPQSSARVVLYVAQQNN